MFELKCAYNLTQTQHEEEDWNKTNESRVQIKDKITNYVNL